MPFDRSKNYSLAHVRGNQKAIRVKKAVTNDNILYSRFRLDALQAALEVLSPNTFKLWCWLNANANDFTFPLSGKEAQVECHFSKATYDKAVKELIEFGYLREAMLFSNFRGYIFVEGGAAQGPYVEELTISPLGK